MFRRIFRGTTNGGSVAAAAPTKPIHPLEQKDPVLEAKSAIMRASKNFSAALLGIPEFRTFKQRADEIEKQVKRKITDVDAVARGHLHKEEEGASHDRLDLLLLKFVNDSNLNLSGDTSNFLLQARALVNSTLNDQRQAASQAPEILGQYSQLLGDLKLFLGTEAGAPLVPLAMAHRDATNNYKYAQGWAMRVDPNPDSPENKLAYTAGLLMDLLQNRSLNRY